jgi:hypothetical protein
MAAGMRSPAHVGVHHPTPCVNRRALKRHQAGSSLGAQHTMRMPSSGVPLMRYSGMQLTHDGRQYDPHLEQPCRHTHVSGLPIDDTRSYTQEKAAPVGNNTC